MEHLRGAGVTAAMQAHAACAERVFRSVNWFWEFIHKTKATAGDAGVYEFHRFQFLDALSQTDITFVPCFHYMTNHLWEDFLNFGPMYFQIGEGTEASHARDNRMRRPTLKGRISENDSWTTWACMMRNYLALQAMVRGKIFDR